MTRRDRDDLLLCPFCGGRATEEVTQEHTANPKHRVLCMTCGVSTPKTVASPIHIDAWNRTAFGKMCDRCAKHKSDGCSAWECIIRGGDGR